MRILNSTRCCKSRESSVSHIATGHIYLNRLHQNREGVKHSNDGDKSEDLPFRLPAITLVSEGVAKTVHVAFELRQTNNEDAVFFILTLFEMMLA